MQKLPYLGVTTLSEVTFKKLGNLGPRSSRRTKAVQVSPSSLPGLAQGRMEVVWLHHFAAIFVVCFSNKCFMFNPVLV